MDNLKNPPGRDIMVNRADMILDISRKASFEQAGCLFHNNYGRGIL